MNSLAFLPGSAALSMLSLCLQLPIEVWPALFHNLLPAGTTGVSIDRFVGNTFSAMRALEHGGILLRGTQLVKEGKCINSCYPYT